MSGSRITPEVVQPGQLAGPWLEQRQQRRDSEALDRWVAAYNAQQIDRHRTAFQRKRELEGRGGGNNCKIVRLTRGGDAA